MATSNETRKEQRVISNDDSFLKMDEGDHEVPKTTPYKNKNKTLLKYNRSAASHDSNITLNHAEQQSPSSTKRRSLLKYNRSAASHDSNITLNHAEQQSPSSTKRRLWLLRRRSNSNVSNGSEPQSHKSNLNRFTHQSYSITSDTLSSCRRMGSKMLGLNSPKKSFDLDKFLRDTMENKTTKENSTGSKEIVIIVGPKSSGKTTVFRSLLSHFSGIPSNFPDHTHILDGSKHLICLLFLVEPCLISLSNALNISIRPPPIRKGTASPSFLSPSTREPQRTNRLQTPSTSRFLARINKDHILQTTSTSIVDKNKVRTSPSLGTGEALLFSVSEELTDIKRLLKSTKLENIDELFEQDIFDEHNSPLQLLENCESKISRLLRDQNILTFLITSEQRYHVCRGVRQLLQSISIQIRQILEHYFANDTKRSPRSDFEDNSSSSGFSEEAEHQNSENSERSYDDEFDSELSSGIRNQDSVMYKGFARDDNSSSSNNSNNHCHQHEQTYKSKSPKFAKHERKKESQVLFPRFQPYSNLSTNLSTNLRSSATTSENTCSEKMRLRKIDDDDFEKSTTNHKKRVSKDLAITTVSNININIGENECLNDSSADEIFRNGEFVDTIDERETRNVVSNSVCLEELKESDNCTSQDHVLTDLGISSEDVMDKQLDHFLSAESNPDVVGEPYSEHRNSVQEKYLDEERIRADYFLSCIQHQSFVLSPQVLSSRFQTFSVDLEHSVSIYDLSQERKDWYSHVNHVQKIIFVFPLDCATFRHLGEYLQITYFSPEDHQSLEFMKDFLELCESPYLKNVQFCVLLNRYDCLKNMLQDLGVSFLEQGQVIEDIVNRISIEFRNLFKSVRRNHFSETRSLRKRYDDERHQCPENQIEIVVGSPLTNFQSDQKNKVIEKLIHFLKS